MDDVTQPGEPIAAYLDAMATLMEETYREQGVAALHRHSPCHVPPATSSAAAFREYTRPHREQFLAGVEARAAQLRPAFAKVFAEMEDPRWESST